MKLWKRAAGLILALAMMFSLAACGEPETGRDRDKDRSPGFPGLSDRDGDETKRPESTNPDPTETEPTETEPAEPEPTESESTEPEPTEPPNRDGTLPDPYTFFNGDVSYSYEEYTSQDVMCSSVNFNHYVMTLDPVEAFLELLDDPRYNLTQIEGEGGEGIDGSLRGEWKYTYNGDPDRWIRINVWSVNRYGEEYYHSTIHLLYPVGSFTFADYGDRYAERLRDHSGNPDGNCHGVVGTVEPEETEPSGEDGPGIFDDECTICGGTGKVFCPSCGGSGVTGYGFGVGGFGGVGRCNTCHGSGKVNCSSCGGDGKR